LEFQDSRLKNRKKNDIWVQPSWLVIENNIRGRWWLPPSLGHGESYESVYAHGSSVHQKWCNFALTNLFRLCKSIWIIDLLATCPNLHPRALACPSYLKVLRVRECTITSFFCCFHFRTHFWIFQTEWGCIINGVLCYSPCVPLFKGINERLRTT